MPRKADFRGCRRPAAACYAEQSKPEPLRRAHGESRRRLTCACLTIRPVARCRRAVVEATCKARWDCRRSRILAGYWRSAAATPLISSGPRRAGPGCYTGCALAALTERDRLPRAYHPYRGEGGRWRLLGGEAARRSPRSSCSTMSASMAAAIIAPLRHGRSFTRPPAISAAAEAFQTGARSARPIAPPP